MNLRTLTRSSFILPALLMTACATEPGSDTSPAAEVQSEARTETDLAVEKLTAAMSDLPGTLVVTRSTGPSLDAETAQSVVKASKVIHIFSDGKVVGYVHSTLRVPGQEEPLRVVREFGGDIMAGPSDKLPDLILARELPEGETRSAQGVGLSQFNGKLWADGTVAYVIDPSFSNASELETLRQSIASWNAAADAWGTQNRVRFVPRYPGDGRSYVSFVRSTDTRICGASGVGNNSWAFSNWWSHNIDIVCVNPGTIHHEMGHTVGLFHEQQRCNRDLFVSVTEGGINCDRYCGGGAQDYVQYNYRSVMHYAYGHCGMSQISPASSDHRGYPWDAGNRSGLDTQDVQSINSMYYGYRTMPRLGAGIFYYLLPLHVPSRAVAVPASSMTNGQQLVLFDRGFSDQHWEFRPDSHGFYEIRNRVTGKCMEVYGFSTSDAGTVVQWDCWGGDNQKWIVAPSAGNSGTFDIINKLSLKSLDVAGANTANGALMQQWGYVGGSNQRFQLSRAY
jgi:hypothetical protein